MSNRTDTEDDADSGLEWFSALEEPLSLAANAGERVEALGADMLEDPLEIEVYCDRPPSMAEPEVVTALLEMLKADIEVEEGASDGSDEMTEGYPRYCKLLGSTLDRVSRNSVAETGSCKLTGFSRVSEVWYRLVATDAEMPIGFCTFSLLFEASSKRGIPETPVCIEIAEIWLAPDRRGNGIGRMLADRVVHLLIHTLLELDARLAVEGASVVTVNVEVGADVYSESGADFTRLVGRLAREQLASALGVYFGEFTCITAADISAYPRF